MALGSQSVRPVLLALLVLAAAPAAAQVQAPHTRAAVAAESRVNRLIAQLSSDDPTVRGAAAIDALANFSDGRRKPPLPSAK